MSEKNDTEKIIDPRKEILFRQIGAKIAYYRTLRDMSQKELSALAGISAVMISSYERNDEKGSNPSDAADRISW